MKRKVIATTHGAISIVNAVATGKGSALGISLKVSAEVKLDKGQGVQFQTGTDNELANNIVYNIINNAILAYVFTAYYAIVISCCSRNCVNN